MDPRDSPEEAAFRAHARSWLADNAGPLLHPPVAPSAIVAECGPEEELDRLTEARRWQARKYDAGWAGIAWPAEYGGQGLTPVEEAMFDEEESRFDVPRDALAVGIGWCGPALLLLGSEGQRRRFLPPMLRGDEVWCQLFSEPGAGSDLAGLATRARRDGDVWVLSGQKTWTTFAHRADRGLCVAPTDPDAERHAGLTAFIVDMRAPGVEARPIRQITGGANFNDVFLDGVRVPDDRRVGNPGDGWRVVTTTFMFERAAARFRVEPMLRSLRERISSAGAGDDPRVDEWVRLWARDRVLSHTWLRTLTAISRGDAPGPGASVLKLLGTSLLTDLYALALDVLGPSGMLWGGAAPEAGGWQAGFLGATGLRIGGGTDEIQRRIIGERILGLPREPQPDQRSTAVP